MRDCVYLSGVLFPQPYDSVILDCQCDWDSASVVSEGSQLASGPSRFSSLGSDARVLLETYIWVTFSRPSAGGSVPFSLFRQRSSPDSIPLLRNLFSRARRTFCVISHLFVRGLPRLICSFVGTLV